MRSRKGGYRMAAQKKKDSVTKPAAKKAAPAAKKAAPAAKKAAPAAKKAAPAAKKTAPAKKKAPAKRVVSAKIEAAGDVLVASATKKSLLFDYYGELLGDRQKEIFTLYNEDNLSLSEIASTVGISRQAVHESLKKAEAVLSKAEDKLGLISRHDSYLTVLIDIEQGAKKLIEEIAAVNIDKKDADRFKRQLRKIAKSVTDLDI
jgi:predicted DNA-binding protein YlxM (UPF0122 family)